MNRRDWRYAKLMRNGITHIIREAAKQGFRVDAVRINKHDRKLLRNANPTRSYMIAGVPVEVDEENNFAPYSRQFHLITNQPEGATDMARQMRGIKFPKDLDMDPKDEPE